MAKLQLLNVNKSFGQDRVINDVNLTIGHGEFCVLVGPSGCGKSTLLRLITGLESVTSGNILIDGADVTNLKPASREVAMVFQSYALFPHMNVAENIGFGLRLAKLPRKEIDRQVTETARVLRIEDLLQRRPKQLSGGQRQRVAIGRSIIRNPKVFLFDEPLSNLDAALRVLMRLEITRLHQRLGATMIFVTHDQTEAMTLADRIVVINSGRIEQTGPPIDVYQNPANRFVAGFIGSPAMNFIEGKLTGQKGRCSFQAGTIELSLDAAHHGEGTVTMGIRPEHIEVASGDDGDLVAEVEIIEMLGAETLLYLKTEQPGVQLAMRVEPEVRLSSGDRIRVRLQRRHIHLFDGDGKKL